MRGDAGPRTAPTGLATAPPSVILRLEPTLPATFAGDRRIVVTDTTWTPRPGREAGEPAPVSLREVAGGILRARDLVAETTEHLDRWVRDAGVLEALTVDGTSFWHYYRLRQWTWLQEQLLWLAIAESLLSDRSVGGAEVAPGVDGGLVDALRLVARARDLPLVIEAEDATTPPAAGPASRRASPNRGTTLASAVRPGGRTRTVWLRGRIRWLRHSLAARVSRDEPLRRRRLVAARIDRLAREPGRLLVVLEHARQRVDTPDGPRQMNPYLGPIVDRLRGGGLDPIEIDIRLRLSADEDLERFREGGDRLLPADAIWISGAPWPADDRQEAADATADAIVAASAAQAAIEVDGVDLAPLLAARLADDVRRTLAGLARNVERVGRLLQRLRPAGILLADEYHRQEWLAAGAAAGIPTAAVQHGLIWRGHAGYVHADRPASLRLPSRTWVFGAWEADLLRNRSIYRDAEVRVGGSPRLDLVRPEPVDRDAVRADLGIGPGERMVVVSGTWNPVLRRFHYPVSLAAIVDRPLPNVHLVVKLHPGEPDDGPYRAVIEGVAAAMGFPPPAVTIVRSIDLYRLLAAADAHLGIQSTVLTEAVWTGTPNLLADSVQASDLLGYVAAGVARPIRNGGDLLAALDAPADADDEARRRFLEAHFEPGNASQRIADELLAWLG